jgi:hypothetical protein
MISETLSYFKKFISKLLNLLEIGRWFKVEQKSRLKGKIMGGVKTLY